MDAQEQPNNKVKMEEIKNEAPLLKNPTVKAKQAKRDKPKSIPKSKGKIPTEVIFTKSKRKRSVARASGISGNGVIRINSRLADTITPVELRFEMLKSIYLSETTKEISKGLNINVNVHGGGVSSQAQAIAGAIARIIAEKGGDSVKKMLMDYDKRLITDDTRRVEPKKFLGPKARARYQTSYR